jgi:hypothetical protein
MQFTCLLLLVTYYVTTYSQTNNVDNLSAAPTANNFAYPQSVFVDSPNGHIWITDFDNHRVLRFDASSLTTMDESLMSSSPASYYLGQNYPNPFNPVTQITFSTKAAGVVVLVVYNLLGQEIATLFNEVATANTVYSIAFDATSLSGGIYLYSLRTLYGNEVKKMCLLK